MKATSMPVSIGKSIVRSRMYIQSQVHSNETHGTPVLLSLIERLKTLDVLGEIIVWPCVNNEGFYNYCISNNGLYDPDNGQNWNRIDLAYLSLLIDYFKDKNDQIHSDLDIEEVIDRLDNRVFGQEYGAKKNIMNLIEPIKLVLRSKYFVDVHTPEFGIEHLYCNSSSSFVKSFGINPTIVDGTNETTFRKFMMKLLSALSQLENEHYATYFADREIVTLELPSHTIIDREYISYWTEKLIGVLGQCRLIEKEIDKEVGEWNKQTYDISSLKYYYAGIDGIFILAVPVGAVVQKNDLIMTIVSIDGTHRVIRAVNQGKFLCFRNKKTVLRGEWVARILEYG